MTTKTISGTYSSGYLLSGSFSTVSITASGSVGGFGLVTSANATVVNYGHLQAQFGANGLTMGKGGGELLNQGLGSVRGGLAVSASGAGASGNRGGAGVYVSVYENVQSLGGDIVGGGGSAGIAGAFGGEGGAGGAGGNFHTGGKIVNESYVFGGGGAAGGASSYGGTARGGTGGGGGDGVYMAASGYVANQLGGLIGGKGGHGGGGVGIGGYGGTGGAAVDLANGGIVAVKAGFVEGGIGGAGGSGGGGGTGGAGVVLRAGGEVANFQLIIGGGGGTGVNGATSGYQQVGSGGAGVALGTGNGSVINFGMISGGAGGLGAGSSRGGIGGAGIAGNGVVVNYGTVISGAGAGRQLSGYGVDISQGWILNGNGSHSTATIEGRASSYGANYTGIGVFAGAGSNVTVTNFGTISGGTAVLLQSSSDVLMVEAGCVFSGAVIGGGGTLELGEGTGAINGLDSVGNVTVTGFVGSAPVFQDFGTLEIDEGGNFSTGVFAAVAAGKTLVVNGVVNDTGSLAVAGSIGGAGTLSVTGKLTMQNKSSLSVADLFVTGNAARVTISSNITFGGDWFQTGGGLTINAARTLNLTNAADVINGKGVIVNGALEVSAGGKLEIQGPVANNGLMEVSGGTLVLENNVTLSGAGSSRINGGIFDASGAFNEAVAFTGATGALILGHSQAYTANITGFSTSGGTSFDLSDVGFVSAGEATFNGTTLGGILTVTDGTHTAKLNLVGNYTASTFTASSDGHGGVIVVDPTAGASAPPASAPAFVAAMAGLGGGGAAASSPGVHAWREPAPMLVASRAHIA